MKIKGRIISLLTAVAMIMAMAPQMTAFANTYGAFTVTTSEDSSNFSYDSNVLTISGSGEYTIKQTSGTSSSTSNRIKITASGDVIINLAGVNIKTNSGSPFEIACEDVATNTVTIVLSNDNTLDASGNNKYAGLQKNSSTNKLVITSASGDNSTEGKLTALGGISGAGIGGAGYGDDNNVDSYSGNITINGGTIIATGGIHGAGIGGGDNSDGTDITINGGNVTATGGQNDDGGAAGIGGGQNGGNGSNITITGGTVTAIGYKYAAGIGGGGNGNASGRSGSGSDITITGGYITVSGDTENNADNIGGGYNANQSSKSATTNIVITGGYFADSYSDGQTTVYDVTPADGYAVYENEESMSSTYPCRVVQKLATPTNLSCSGTTASWSEVDNASSYLVQLCKEDGTAVGDAVTTTETSTTFTITEAGSYTFTVTAVGTGKYGNSDTATSDVYYTVTWNDGSEDIEIDLVQSREIPTAPANPTKASDSKYTYKFAGWDKEIVAVTEATTYTATYTATAKSSSSSYSLSEGSSSLSSSSADEEDSTSTSTSGSDTTSDVFTDLSTDYTYYDAVMEAYEKGYMAGTSATTFEADGHLTRAMAAQILHNLAGNPDPEDVAPFLDVTSGEWYSDAIAWCYEQGLIIGYDYINFGPDDYVTTEQFSIMLAKYYNEVVPGYVGGAPNATRGWVAYMITA